MLQPDALSQVTVSTITLTEVFVFGQQSLMALDVKFNAGTMKALQESFLFHSPPESKIIELEGKKAKWDSQKAKIIRDVLHK